MSQMKIKEFQSLLEKHFPGVIAGHFEKLVESHKLSGDMNLGDFFVTFEKDDFFDKANMPAKWTIRTYSYAMESIMTILNDPETSKEVTGDVAKLLKLAETNKRKYMSLYKSIRRKHKATSSPSKSDKVDEGGDEKGDDKGKAKKEESDDESIDLEINMDDMHADFDQTRTNSATSNASGVASGVSGEGEDGAGEDGVEDTSTLTTPAPSDISALCTNDDLVCKHKLSKRIAYITEMIDLFMKSEDDDKRKTILQVIKNSVVRLTGEDA